MLYYQRPTMKDGDVYHRTKTMGSVQERAKAMEAELDKELEVCTPEFVRSISQLNKALEDCPGKVSLTFDGWTSKIMTAYLAITAHYITADWELKSDLLSFQELEGSHSGENIGDVLFNTVVKHGLANKVRAHWLCPSKFDPDLTSLGI